MEHSLGHGRNRPGEPKAPGADLASSVFKCAYIDGCKALADGNAQISADPRGLLLRANTQGDLRVAFSFRPGTEASSAGLIGHSMQIQSLDGEVISSLPLSPQSWTHVVDSFSSGRQSEFLALISDPWPRITDRWLKWHQFNRIVVPWPALDPPIGADADKHPNQDAIAKVFRMPSEGSLVGGRAPKLNNWIERGFWTVVDGFPVVLTACPGLVAPNEFIRPGFITKDGGRFRTWSPGIEEIFNHITGSSSYLEQMQSQQCCELVDRRGTLLLEHLRRSRKKLG
jgi:hypothetical protein